MSIMPATDATNDEDLDEKYPYVFSILLPSGKELELLVAITDVRRLIRAIKAKSDELFELPFYDPHARSRALRGERLMYLWPDRLLGFFLGVIPPTDDQSPSQQPQGGDAPSAPFAHTQSAPTTEA